MEREALRKHEGAPFRCFGGAAAVRHRPLRDRCGGLANEAPDAQSEVARVGGRLRRKLGIALTAGGVLLLAWLGVTLGLGEPFPALYRSHEQHALAGRLATVERHWTPRVVQAQHHVD